MAHEPRIDEHVVQAEAVLDDALTSDSSIPCFAELLQVLRGMSSLRVIVSSK